MAPGLLVVRSDVMCLWYVPLYANARWLLSRVSGKGSEFGLLGGVYPSLPIAAGLGVLCWDDRIVLKAVFARICVVSLRYIPWRAKSLRLVCM